jgi:glycosyltransferase involved in cell wall biosynthesis
VRNRLYYRFKPYLPWGLRMGLRRWMAKGIRERAVNWPINPAAAAPPEGWPGWPEGRRFAFVLTHDVEGHAGVANVKRLAELEMSLGFRSSFNFIPEGEYSVPIELLDWLRENGFEVGVHDLHHDGSLYRSGALFRRQAERINHYLKAWDAVGFRSGFMLNNLEWIQQLNVLYDASTFDVDPFEPQPSGAGTIFPFKIDDGNDGGRSYVELPYTLPQDSTLFLVLREAGPDIWLRKFEWLVEQGGMALVNVHPDYLRFDDQKANGRTFPVAHYIRLLETAARRRDAAWAVLPCDLARWFSTQSITGGPSVKFPARASGATAGQENGSEPERRSLAGRRVAVLLYSSYPSDSRPRRAAEAMAAAGAEVELLALQEAQRAAPTESIRGVDVTRAPLVQRRGGLVRYLYQYGFFFIWCFFTMAWRSMWRPYDVVHVHNMPDFLVWAAWPAKLRGAKVILDLHDPMPELFMSLHQKGADNRLIRLLRWVEGAAIGFSQMVLTPNEAFRQRFVLRNGAFGKTHVIMNSPEEEIFHSGRADNGAPRTEGALRLMYHGLIAERHGLDVAVEALAIVAARVPGVTLDVFGASNAYLDEVLRLADTRGIGSRVRCHGLVTEAVIAENIARCDLGIIPNRLSPFTAINMPTRIFEYLVMGRPVVVPQTRGIRDYFKPDEILYFEPNRPESLARTIEWVYDNPAASTEVARRGRSVYTRHRWCGEKRKLLSLLGRLLSPTAPADAPVFAAALPEVP